MSRRGYLYERQKDLELVGDKSPLTKGGAGNFWNIAAEVKGGGCLIRLTETNNRRGIAIRPCEGMGIHREMVDSLMALASRSCQILCLQ